MFQVQDSVSWLGSISYMDAKLEHEKTVLSRQVEATDTQINMLVYDLYGLTEEEIKIKGGRE
jgi:hypothetical protein